MSEACKICFILFKNRRLLCNHLKILHNIKIEDYILIYKYNNVWPLCRCGCGIKTKFLNRKDFALFMWGHNGRKIYSTHKICNKCKKEKDLSCFYKNKNLHSKFSSLCKECIKSNVNNYRKKNSNIVKSRKKKYYLENIAELSEIRKLKYIKNKEKERNQQKKYYELNKQEKYFNPYYNRYRNDIEFKLKVSLRNRLNRILNGKIKCGSFIRDLGCSVKELKLWLESKFFINPRTGEMMSWDSYGLYGWHIDHIMPLSSFDLTNREQFLRACHYTNLRPLWAKENLSKGAKIL